MDFLLLHGLMIHFIAFIIALLSIIALTSLVIYEHFSKRETNYALIKTISLLIGLFIIVGIVITHMSNMAGALTLNIIGLIGVICTIILIVLLIIESFSPKKNIKDLVCKTTILLVCLFVMVLYIPYHFNYKAMIYSMSNSTISKAEKYYLLAKDTAIIPPVKTLMYSELLNYYGIYYKGKDKGKKVIDIYENDAKFSKNVLKYSKTMICTAYFWKPDREKLIQNCGSELHLAVDYMRTKEYDKALEVVNNRINEYENRQPEYADCIGYGVRAAINKQLGNSDAYKKDYDEIMSRCSSQQKHTFKTAKQLAETDYILKVFGISTKQDWQNTY